MSLLNRGRARVWLVTAAVLACLVPLAATAEEKPLTFERDIAPILQARCLRCHGGGKIEAGLDLRRKSLIMQGGDSGAALVAGKPDESLLLTRVESGEMPPEGEPALDETQRKLLRRWIAAGAPLAGEKEEPLEQAEPPSRVTPEDRQFWSFQPPVRASLPQVSHADQLRTAVDAFILARLEEKGLSFAPEAPKEVLLRRATFALHGLPPTIAEQEAFNNDDRPDAFERLIDRLLASPRFGEHAARHWLDLAGYADSDGYLAADRLRPEAWRYRDYVIEALNRDLPYDQFITEQLAGDEISDWRRAEELTPKIERQLAATGFLRTASDPTYPGYIEPNEIHQVLADTMQIVSTSLLGLTVQCARCHSHKFDPISQRDYYSLQAIFAPALDAARWQPSGVRGIPLATEREQQRVEERNKKVDERLKEIQTHITDLQARYRKQRVAEALGPEGSDGFVVTQVVTALTTAAAKQNAEQKALAAKYSGQISLSDEALSAWNDDFKQQLAKLKAAAAAEGALKQSTTLVRGLIDLEGPPPEFKLLIRGDYNKPGPGVPPDVPEVLAPVSYQFEAVPSYKTTGRRTALARWLTSGEHPLTSRVHVNRVWDRLFGRGIVTTLANFGHTGAKPTHPQLLDWLAVEFRERGWQQKDLYRQLVTSSAWRQSSEPPAATKTIDPTNELLGHWRAARHTGEMLRDSTLAVSGKLNPHMFGPSVPVEPHGDGSVTIADSAAGNRRSVYLIVRRSQHVTMLDLFDVPMMEVNCPERPNSIVPLQALALLHAPFAERSATALAERILRESEATDEARTRHAWRLLFARHVKPEEQSAVSEFLTRLRSEQPPDAAKLDQAVWTQLALVLLNSNEFLFVH